MRYGVPMRQPRVRHIGKWLVAALLAALLTSAWAQEIDPRGLELLEGLSGADLPEELRNMDMTMTSVTFIEGEEISSTSRSVVDYENERAVIISTVMGMETRMVMADGQVKMTAMGMSLPMPPGAESEFDSIFDQPSTNYLVDSAERITFDGPVNYGDMLVGDQVTYVGDAGVYGTPDSPEIHYVFAADGALLGLHIPADEGEMLLVYDEPLQSGIITHDSKVYMLQNGEWTLFQQMTIESMEYNVELDESLFE